MGWEAKFGNWRHFLLTCKEIGYHPINPHIETEDDIIQTVQWIDPTAEWHLHQCDWLDARKALETILGGTYEFSPWTVFVPPDHLSVVLAFSDGDDLLVFRLAAP
jgi:hypothetical protein